jgi:hypothetical protein
MISEVILFKHTLQILLKLLNKTEQLIISKQINHAEGNNAETILLDKYFAHGIYQLEIAGPDGNKINMDVIY